MTGIIITQAKEMTWISLTVDANWLFIKLTGCVKKKRNKMIIVIIMIIWMLIHLASYSRKTVWFIFCFFVYITGKSFKSKPMVKCNTIFCFLLLHLLLSPWISPHYALLAPLKIFFRGVFQGEDNLFLSSSFDVMVYHHLRGFRIGHWPYKK